MSDDLRERQVAYVEQCLRVFTHFLGTVVELRALGVQGRRAVSLCSADLRELAVRAVELDAVGASGCYFTLNPLRPDLAGAETSCRDEDVVERHWLPVDVDSWRPAGTPSTQAELDAAWTVLCRCRGILDGAGLGNPVVGMSGNGWHLCYPIQAPNDQTSKDLVRGVLRGLHERCSDKLTEEEQASLKSGEVLSVPKARVDVSTFNASRIWKLYGTRSRKGEATAQRPHRYARLVEPLVESRYASDSSRVGPASSGREEETCHVG